MEGKGNPPFFRIHPSVSASPALMATWAAGANPSHQGGSRVTPQNIQAGQLEACLYKHWFL